MTIREGLTRSEARWAIAQSGLAAMHDVLTYAEGFAIVAAGVGVAMGEPARLVRRLVEDTIGGTLCWSPTKHTFPIHLRMATRLEIAGRMALHARLRGTAPALWEVQLVPMQVGDLRGVEQLAHWAAEMMPTVRSNDGKALDAAVKLTDFVRRRIEPFAGNPDDEDTARNVTPAVVAVVIGESDDKKTN
jgi:hypothetical protein